MKSLFVSYFCVLEELTPEGAENYQVMGNTVIKVDDTYQDFQVTCWDDIKFLEQKIKDDYNAEAKKGTTHMRMNSATVMNYKWMEEASL